MIYTLGETLMDIIFDSNGQVSATPGGAMLNVSVSLARKKTAVGLISELGDDVTGFKINNFLKENGVATEFVSVYPQSKTSLALAFLDENAKPTYSFYKTYPPKRFLNTNIGFTANDYLLFGSVYSLDEAIRPDIIKIVEAAKGRQAVVVYDPNIRHAHHLSNQILRKAVYENMALADIVKGSDEDFANIFGAGNPAFWKNKINEINPVATVIITLGQAGSIIYFQDKIIELPAPMVKVKSTVGAGDAYSAGLLYKISQIEKSTENITTDEWRKIINVATQWAASVCTSKENYINPHHLAMLKLK